MIVGFCTPCMNRLWQLEHTLPHNLALLRGSGHFVALCDYNSSDALESYVEKHFAADRAAGTLVYFRTTQPSVFHASKAKNAAHRLALRSNADVVFNLDADNFLTAETFRQVVERFATPESRCLHQWSGVWGDGSFGRIALRGAEWQKLGGYDETFREMGWQDMDLLYRARAMGLAYERSAVGLKAAIPNTMLEKFRNVGLPVPSDAVAFERFRRFNSENLERALARPVALRLDDQARYPGRLNFESDVVI